MSIRTRLPHSVHPDVRARLVDTAMDRYIDWREQSAAAVEAYETWGSAPHAQLPLAFAAYRAALEQEECAASVYARAIEALERLLQRERPRGAHC